MKSETSKQNKKIKKIGSKAVPKEKTNTVKFQRQGDFCLKNNSNCFYFENSTQAWATVCVANLTIVLVALITLSHTVVRHKNALFSLRVTNMTFYLTLDKLLNSDFFVFIYTLKRFMLQFSIKLFLWFIVQRPLTHDVFCVTNKIKNVWRSDVTKAFS